MKKLKNSYDISPDPYEGIIREEQLDAYETMIKAGSGSTIKNKLNPEMVE